LHEQYGKVSTCKSRYCQIPLELRQPMAHFYRIPAWLEVGSAGREVGALHLSGMGKQSRFASGSWTQTALTHSSHNILHRPKTSNNTLQDFVEYHDLMQVTKLVDHRCP